MKALPGLILLSITALALWLFYERAEGQTVSYTCVTDTGQRIYRGSSDLAAFGYCKLYLLRDKGPWATWSQEGGRKLAIYNTAGQGVWTWVPPTALENGNILTDLSHYLMYRQAPGGQPTVYAQVDGKAKRLIVAMQTPDFNACFWFVAVRKPATSPPVASDRSNVICLDPVGLPLPAA